MCFAASPLVAPGGAARGAWRLQARRHHERRRRVHEQHLEQLQRRDLVQRDATSCASEVHLLEILVEHAAREQLGEVFPGRRRSASLCACERSAGLVTPAAGR